MAYLIRLYNLNTLYVLPNIMTSILIDMKSSIRGKCIC